MRYDIPNDPLHNFFNTFPLVIFAATSRNDNYSTYREHSSSSGYQVPEFFNLRVKAVQVYHVEDEISVVRQSVIFGYAEDDVGLPSAIIPSNPVYFINEADVPSIACGNTKMNQMFVDFLIPSLTYPFCWDGGKVKRCVSQMYGILEEIT